MAPSLSSSNAESPGSTTAENDPRDMEVREMLMMVVCALVDEADQVVLLHVTSSDGVAFQVRTAPTDTGKLIGKSGRTARAIRTILNGSAVRNKRRYTLDIAHSPGHTPASQTANDRDEED